MKVERKASGRRVGLRAFCSDMRVFHGVWLGEPGEDWRVRKGSRIEERCSFMKGMLSWNSLG